MKRRSFYKNILNHCYQRSAGGVLFYTYSDHLVYFTNFCILARQYGIQVLAACQMPDHVHDALVAQKLQDLVFFKKALNARFAKQYNAHCKTTGPVFETPFNNAPKTGAKKARTNLIYIGNNAVERQLVARAEEYRWNYLAYAVSDHPFSVPIVIRRSSKALRVALRVVKAQFQASRPLNYPLLKRVTENLNPAEVQQFTDYVISTYNVIDYAQAIRYFDSYEDMITSMHATTGSEYDINEVFVGKSDKPYATMSRILLQECNLSDIHEILSMSIENKWRLFSILRKHTSVMGVQIAAFLHLPLKKEVPSEMLPFSPSD